MNLETVNNECDYQFKINSISLLDDDNNKLIPKKVNIIIGANNVGKSLFLKEIRDFLIGKENIRKIVSSIDYAMPESFRVLENAYNIRDKIYKDAYNSYHLKTYSNAIREPNQLNGPISDMFIQQSNTYVDDIEREIDRLIEFGEDTRLRELCGSLFFQYLGTEERLLICKTQMNLGLDDSRSNFLSAMKYQRNILKELSAATKRLFEKEIYLDETTLGDRIVFRVADSFLDITSQARLDEDKARKLALCETLDEQGDGLKSFVSSFLSLYFKEKEILLLDEPEAFLHPPLARQMGEMIGEAGEVEDKSIYVATHSVEILKGILSRCNDVNILRIDRVDGITSITNIDQNLLHEVLSDPLLRASRILEGVFCDKVIVTEADADEVLYQELIEKKKPQSGIYFTHGQNKQTLVKLVRFYKQIGVKCLMIVDFDFIRVVDEVAAFLQNVQIDESERQQILKVVENARSYVNESFDRFSFSMKFENDDIKSSEKKKYRNNVYHEKGIRFFPDEIQSRIKEMLDKLQNYGLFVIRSGELETILEPFGLEYKKSKATWIAEALIKVNSLNNDDIKQAKQLDAFLVSLLDY